MRLHDEFEWDSVKAAGNRRKHGVTFEDAAAVLRDEQGDVYHVDKPDDAGSTGEDRYLTWGSHPDNRSLVLLVCWTDRSTDETRITRIISARRARPHERKTYAEEIHEP
jgi:uncharacterized DUF497 family protein